jgi:hypothetical protein
MQVDQGGASAVVAHVRHQFAKVRARVCGELAAGMAQVVKEHERCGRSERIRDTPSARQAVRPNPGSDAKPGKHRGIARPGGRDRAGTKPGRRAQRPTPGPGGIPRPAGAEALGRAAAARSARPHPQADTPRAVGSSDPRELAGRPPRAGHSLIAQTSASRALAALASPMAQAPPQTLIFRGKTRDLSGGQGKLRS